MLHCVQSVAQTQSQIKSPFEFAPARILKHHFCVHKRTSPPSVKKLKKKESQCGGFKGGAKLLIVSDNILRKQSEVKEDRANIQWCSPSQVLRKDTDGGGQ